MTTGTETVARWEIERLHALRAMLFTRRWCTVSLYPSEIGGHGFALGFRLDGCGQYERRYELCLGWWYISVCCVDKRHIKRDLIEGCNTLRQEGNAQAAE